jgi:hypothetical protein
LFRDRPETVRLHRGIGVDHHPGVLFGFITERRSESSERRSGLLKREDVVQTLKLTEIGTSTGTVIPKEMLKRLKVKKSDSLYAIETPEGCL